ncbi:type IV pilus twitching motility protein PilT [Desulfuribacillus alkaliarsenatis]|uniref:Type IV pili twitching motility protein PilT n=1 Tax=Desulfuribacillus alkaliarsenatis TaxID=766136 RepID=A0A1E5G6E9_9FIRM|nr:type IV pilus twitching motility protein PilT [Desulfuribacillus alkaliarsenatis]OEF98324.1 type IV pili twitching motility protein PilT [Desulfuribacillus alkaliarsenatis]
MIMKDILLEAVKIGASDIHLTVNATPMYRLHGRLTSAGKYQAAFNRKLTHEDMEQLMQQVTDRDQQQKLAQKGDLDFSFEIQGVARFRVNIFKQQKHIAIVMRIIPTKILTMEQLNLPPVFRELSNKRSGLVLVTGPTGSGKSTTLAAMIDYINENKNEHIITLEDPLEFIHQHKGSVINQREIHQDTESFASALRAAMRQDPDVILVGEMRDLETISTAITAAETGHLVFGTLHTSSAASTVDRIIDVFPPHQQQQIRIQLAATLQGVIAQLLLPKQEGGRVAAMEILTVTPAVRNLIREGKTHQIPSSIQTGGKYGMQSMDQALKALLQRGLISQETADKLFVDKENATASPASTTKSLGNLW